MMDEKPQQWRDLTVRISGIADKLGMPIDAGIRETVIALNALGFTTRQSCESHLDHGTGAPWVDVISTSTKIYEDRQVPYDRRLVIQSLSSGIYRLESQGAELDRKSTRLNSSHTVISYCR